MAQTPEMFNYQGVARDNSGNVLANQSIGLRITIENGITALQYQEVWNVTTNDFGLFNINVGSGSVTGGSFSGIDWSSGGPYSINVEMDASGGTAYQQIGISQLLSVPYALHAETSGDGLPNGSSGQTIHHDGANWTATSNLYNDGTNIGIGTTSPSSLLELKDDVSGTTKIVVSNSDAGGSQNLRFEAGSGTAEMWFSNSANALTLKAIPSGSVLNLYGRNNDGITIDDNGNVGVGTGTPNSELEVNGDLEFSGSGSSILAPGAFNVESTTGVDVIIDNDDNSTNSSFKVKRNGESETIFEVKESGNVEVEGDYAYATSKTHYFSLYWNDFNSIYPQTYLFGQGNPTSNRWGEFVSGGTAFGYSSAPLHLPDGATITELRAWIWDNSSTNPVRVELEEHTLGTTGLLEITQVESDAATISATIQELSSTINHTVDNSVNSYAIRFTGKQNSTDTRLYGVRVTYTVDQAD